MYYKIYTRRIAYLLRQKGFKIVKTEINKNHPQFDVYIFLNSPELQAALTGLSH